MLPFCKRRSLRDGDRGGVGWGWSGEGAPPHGPSGGEPAEEKAPPLPGCRCVARGPELCRGSGGAGAERRRPRAAIGASPAGPCGRRPRPARPGHRPRRDVPWAAAGARPGRLTPAAHAPAEGQRRPPRAAGLSGSRRPRAGSDPPRTVTNSPAARCGPARRPA